MKFSNKNSFIYTFILWLAVFLLFLFFSSSVFAEATSNNQIAPNPAQNAVDAAKNARVDTASAGLAAKVAPGELLPISVKLSNFGGGTKVDVIVQYQIFNSAGKEIYTATETVAVETTASFVKTIQIPFDTIPGKYIAKSSITYNGQITPATTEFSFMVERKIFGLFQSDFYLYLGIILLISVMVGVISHAWIRRRRIMRLAPLDYSNISHHQRIFYEILSDTIMQMRQRVGDNALLIAENTVGLKIDKKSGRVLALTEQPSKVIATLVFEYEKLLGKEVSFSLRQEKLEKKL